MTQNIIIILFFSSLFISSCTRPDVIGKDDPFLIFISSSSQAEDMFYSLVDGTLNKDDAEEYEISSNDSAAVVIYYAAMASLSENDDEILESSLKSLTILNNCTGKTGAFIPDTLLNIMGQNFSGGLAYYYSHLSHSVYDTIPQYSILLNKKAANLHAKNNNYKWAAYAYLNMAKLYEMYDEIDASVLMAGNAITIWEETGDSLQLASLYKYKGLLLGKSKMFKEGKEYINEAYNMYFRLNFEPGKYVSLHDLGELYFIEGNYDSSLFCFFSEKEYWRQVNDSQRYFIANNSLIKTHDKFNDGNNVTKLIKENENIIASPVISEVSRKEYFVIKSGIILKYDQKKHRDVIRPGSINTMFASLMYRNYSASSPELIL